MKSAKLLKHLTLWLFNLICYSVIMLGTVYFLYWTLIKFKIDGKLVAEIWADFAASFPGFVVIFHIDNGLLSTIDFILTLIFIFGGLAIIYIGVPIFILGIAVAVSESFIIYRKNNWCEAFICLENIFHLKHKERLTGTEWAKRRKEKLEEDRKRKEREENHTQAEYIHKQYEERQRAEQERQYREWQRQEEQDQNYSGNYSSTEEPLSEVNKAKYTLMIDENQEFTKKELKLIRNKFIKKFHSDNDEENESYAQKINAAYDILLQYAREDI